LHLNPRAQAATFGKLEATGGFRQQTGSQDGVGMVTGRDEAYCCPSLLFSCRAAKKQSVSRIRYFYLFFKPNVPIFFI
jgi:hypothetical protein